MAAAGGGGGGFDAAVDVDDDGAAAAAAAFGGGLTKSRSSAGGGWDGDLEELIVLFPTADPNFLFDELASRTGDPMRVRIIADTLLETKTYPKRPAAPPEDEVQAMRRRKQQRERWLKAFEKDLELTPDGRIVNKTEEAAAAAAAGAGAGGGGGGAGGGGKPSEAYKNAALAYLLNTFSKYKKETVRAALQANGGMLIPTKKFLEHKLALPDRKAYALMRSTRPHTAVPPCAEEGFERDMWICDSEAEITATIQKRKQLRAEKEKQAKEEGLLLECPCCYADEFLIDDMVQCEKGHLFCMDCVRQSCNSQIGYSRTVFPCLSSDGCKAVFSNAEVQKVLPESVMEAHWARVQAEELALAALSDLEACPFCKFALIMENKEDREIKCQNPECMKVSCRLCKERSHIPLRCSEVEKTDEVAMRKFIEDKMTMALCRKCWKCSKLFYKEEGCNKMECVCGAKMCYVCSSPLDAKDPYSHYKDNKKCELHTDTKKLNKDRVVDGGRRALEEFLEEHPEMAEVEMKHDPLADLVPKKKKKTR